MPPSLADHVIILGAGVVAAQGTPAEVRASTDPLVHQFVNALPTGPVPFHYPGPTAARILVRWTGGLHELVAPFRCGPCCAQPAGRHAGLAARLFWRLVRLFPAALQRPGLVRDQVHFLGNYSLAIIAVSGLFVGFVLALQGYYTLQDLALPRRWASWWR
jgi:hypothetical protein